VKKKGTKERIETTRRGKSTGKKDDCGFIDIWNYSLKERRWKKKARKGIVVRV